MECESARLHEPAPEHAVPVHATLVHATPVHATPVHAVPVHGGGRRVLPAHTAAPAHAWHEAETRHLLPVHHKLQEGLTLGLHAHYPHKPLLNKTFQKTKFQKRKEKLIEVLRPPYFILSMIILIVGIHVLGSAELRAQLEWAPGAWRAQPWRVLSYGFVHANNAHLALNALVALAVGWRLEREQGWWRVACAWCAGVAAGALGAGVLQPAVKVVGASAAVYALLTAHLPNVCLRFGHIPLWWFRPLSVVVLCASEGCWALVRATPPRPAVHPPLAPEHVAWAAHVLGAAVAVPLAFIIFTGENSKKKHIVACRVVSAVVLVVGLALAVYHYTLGEGADT